MSSSESPLLGKKLIVPDDAVQNITFIVTEDCQLRCKYCYICGKNSFKVMSFETAKAAIDYVLEHSEIYSAPKLMLDFIGGEPFLEIDLIDKICDYFKMEAYRRNHPWFETVQFTFSSNGLLYDSSKVQKFIQKNRRRLNIGISIDGTKEKHDLMRVFPSGKGCYDEVVSKIPLWLEQFEYSPNTKATVGHDDLPLVKDSVLHLWELGISRVAMNVIFENVWQEGDDEILENQLVALADEILEKKLYLKNQCSFFERSIGFYIDKELDNTNWCGAGLMNAVDTEGGFHPCLRFAQYSLENKEEILTGRIGKGVDLNKLRPFQALNRTVQSPQECIDCEVASGCAWCQGFNYDSADTETIYQRATFICKMHKARVRANNYLWNKLDRIVPPAEDDVRVLHSGKGCSVCSFWRTVPRRRSAIIRSGKRNVRKCRSRR